MSKYNYIAPFNLDGISLSRLNGAFLFVLIDSTNNTCAIEDCAFDFVLLNLYFTNAQNHIMDKNIPHIALFYEISPISTYSRKYSLLTNCPIMIKSMTYNFFQISLLNSDPKKSLTYNFKFQIAEIIQKKLLLK